MLCPADFFDLEGVEHPRLLTGRDPVWRVLTLLEGYIESFLSTHGARILGEVAAGAHVGSDVYLGAGTKVETGACIVGPAVVGPRNEVRNGAYIREGVVTGAEVIIGHGSEVKMSLLLEGSAAAHQSYVGDSILGRRVNLGAGTILSNVPMTSLDPDRWLCTSVVIDIEGAPHDTGLVKLGAVLGDDAKTGCNVVTNPGCLIGPRTLVYPNVSVPKGYYGPDRVIKPADTVVVQRRRRRPDA